MKRFIGFVMCLVLLVPFGLSAASANQTQYTGFSEMNPLSSALHVLPPIGNNNAKPTQTDQTLTNFLSVAICQVDGDGCTPVHEFTSQKSNKGLDYIKLQNKYYHVNWKISKSDLGKTFEVHFLAAGLRIGNVTYTPKSSRTIPIRFQIDNHPMIRVRILREQGYSVIEIAQALSEEFNLDQDELLSILIDEGYVAYDIYNVLVNFYSLSVIESEHILYYLGFSPDDYLEFTTYAWVSRYAPVLKFDSAHKGLPMSAQVYFETILDPYTITGNISWGTPWDGPCGEPGVVLLCARDECTCGMENNDFSKLLSGEVPTYYKVISDIEDGDEGRLRIAYWWFYGFQKPCSYVDGCPGADGSHHGDWEHLVITTSPDREQIDYVTYFFHGDWYTRSHGNYYVYPDGSGERPVVFVGKLAHGSYHNQEHSGWMAGTPHHCCEYADYRNPTINTVWANVQDNLVSLRGNSEPWMLADRIGSTFKFDGSDYVIVNWGWGPHISYCDWWLFGCMDWEHNYAPMTHPTIDTLNWDLLSCDEEGCGDTYCEGLIYDENGVYFNQSWPWDN